MGQQSNNCSQATTGYTRLQQATSGYTSHGCTCRCWGNKGESESETKTTKSKRNRSETKNESQPERNEPKMEKKAILYFAINRKNCSFYCFQSVFCFFGGGVAPVIAEKVCMWQAGGKEAAGTWHTRGKRCVSRQKEKKQKEVIEGKGGRSNLPACLPYLPCRWPKDITAKCYA